MFLVTFAKIVTPLNETGVMQIQHAISRWIDAEKLLWKSTQRTIEGTWLWLCENDNDVFSLSLHFSQQFDTIRRIFVLYLWLWTYVIVFKSRSFGTMCHCSVGSKLIQRSLRYIASSSSTMLIIPVHSRVELNSQIECGSSDNNFERKRFFLAVLEIISLVQMSRRTGCDC